MASKKVSDQILLFEAANFKGTPKQFARLANQIRETFPNYQDEISDLAAKIPLNKNRGGITIFGSPAYMNTSAYEY